eukprot:NODE_409_length_9212_cov_0.585537.p11 type:complete len:118 gc:universal NODE_409_length_9212_cov_0.585537:6279-6632(+)
MTMIVRFLNIVKTGIFMYSNAFPEVKSISAILTLTGKNCFTVTLSSFLKLTVLTYLSNMIKIKEHMKACVANTKNTIDMSNPLNTNLFNSVIMMLAVQYDRIGVHQLSAFLSSPICW